MKALRVSMSGLDLQPTADPQPPQTADQIVEGQAQRKGFFNQRRQVTQADQAAVKIVKVRCVDAHHGSASFKAPRVGHFCRGHRSVPDGNVGLKGAFGAIRFHTGVGHRIGSGSRQTLAPSIRMMIIAWPCRSQSCALLQTELIFLIRHAFLRPVLIFLT